MGRRHRARRPISFTPSPATRSPKRRPAASTSRRWWTTRRASAARRCAQMTFHERALMLKAMAQYLMARKDEFYRRLRGHRRDEAGFVGRHRGRHRDVLRLRVARAPRVSERALLRRRPDRGAVEGRHVRRPAHLRAARGRRRPHQRVQLPRVGHAREAGADVARRHAGDREAGDGDVVSSPKRCSAR